MNWVVRRDMVRGTAEGARVDEIELVDVVPSQVVEEALEGPQGGDAPGEEVGGAGPGDVLEVGGVGLMGGVDVVARDSAEGGEDGVGGVVVGDDLGVGDMAREDAAEVADDGVERGKEEIGVFVEEEEGRGLLEGRVHFLVLDAVLDLEGCQRNRHLDHIACLPS